MQGRITLLERQVAELQRQMEHNRQPHKSKMTLKERLLRSLVNGPMSTDELVEVIGWQERPRSVSTTLWRMKLAGMVTRDGKRWTIRHAHDGA